MHAEMKAFAAGAMLVVTVAGCGSGAGGGTKPVGTVQSNSDSKQMPGPDVRGEALSRVDNRMRASG